MQYDNTNTIVIFKNTNKKSEKAPDWSAKLNVNGVEYEAPLWVKQGRVQFLAGPIQAPYEQRQQQAQSAPRQAPQQQYAPQQPPQPAPQQAQQQPDDFDPNDIPF